jgi:hypothetical protein
MKMENKPRQGLPALISLIIAFLLPIAVFAGVAIECKRLLTKHIERQDIRTVISFLIAAAVTLAILYAIRIVNRRHMKDK